MSRKAAKVIEGIVKEIRAKKPSGTPKTYRRAATQRLGAAEFLLKNSKYYLDALYLAGYAVECAMKAMILDGTPRSKWADAINEIGSGAKAHGTDYLRGILRRREVSVPPDVDQCLNEIRNEWDTSLRYVGSSLPQSEVISFVDCALKVCNWAGGNR
jgi:HEPN domain-containing protein